VSRPATQRPGETGEANEREAELAARAIVASLLASIAAGVGLIVVYVKGGQPQWEGALLMVALGGIGISIILFAAKLLGDQEITADRPPLPSTEPERIAFRESLGRGEKPFTRRKLLSRLLGAAAGTLGLAALFPLRSLGPTPGRTLFRTAWRRGSRLVASGSDRAVKVDDLEVGGVLTVFPENHVGEEDSAVVLIRVRTKDLRMDGDRRSKAPQGHVAYSKICTHVGCPVGLYQESTQTLLCPCHQSTFDVLDGAKPVFGPATRHLPQLPLAVDGHGYLIATDDFSEPIGPGFWNRQRP